MSKYDDFINELKEESLKQEIPDLKQTIKVKYLNQDTSNRKVKHFNITKLAYAFMIVVVIGIISIFPLKDKSNEKPNNNYIPNMPTTVSDTYAFELVAATNIIINNNDTFKNLATREVLENIANIVHKEYMAIRQMLYSDKTSYEIIASTDDSYTDEMIIKLTYDNFDLECKVYYNKVLKEIDDDEEVYDINGIIIINGETYQVVGETEKETDETETKLKIIMNDNNYFIIEEEYEEDEKEFVYAYYVNNKLIQRNTLSIEKENGEIEIVIEQKGLENGELKIKNKNNTIEIEADYPDYKGNIKVVDNGETIKYTFQKEKETIEIKIIKKILNITNKNDKLIVY